jgi:hypothetical protein
MVAIIICRISVTSINEEKLFLWVVLFRSSFEDIGFLHLFLHKTDVLCLY